MSYYIYNYSCILLFACHPFLVIILTITKQIKFLEATQQYHRVSKAYKVAHTCIVFYSFKLILPTFLYIQRAYYIALCIT